MAGTVTLTTDTVLRDKNMSIVGRRLVIDATADASDGSFPDLTLKKLSGYIQTPIITNPGSTAPTDNWDMVLKQPSTGDSTADVLGSQLLNRDTANTEYNVANLTGASNPVYVNGNYVLSLSGNSVNSATIKIVMEILFLTE